jgi:hypothetical protein
LKTGIRPSTKARKVRKGNLAFMASVLLWL